MKRRFFKLSSLLLLSALMLTACSGNGANSSDVAEGEDGKKDITLVTIESSLPIMEKVSEVMENKGYTTKINLVDLNVPVMESVQDGSADGGLGVQIKFLENFNEKNNGNLVIGKPYPYYTGIGLYSNKFDDLKDLPENARISIMHDPINMDMAMRMLRDHGVIELDENKNDLYTPMDITKNPKNIELIEVDQTQTYRMIDDLDAVIAWFATVKNAGDDATSYIIRNLDGENYPMGIVLRKEDENKKWAKDLAEAMHDPIVKDFVLSEYSDIYNYIEQK